MLRSILFITLLALTTSLSAESALTVWLSSQQNGGGDRFPSSRPNATIEFANGSGYGLSATHTFGRRFSGELGVFRLSSDATLRDAGIDFVDLGQVELTPITAMLRWHVRPGAAFDVYLGGGAAYVLTDDLDSADLRADGLAPLALDDETVAVLGAGAIWNFRERWGVAVDARYLPLTLHARARGQSAEADLDPLIVSAGLRVRF